MRALPRYIYIYMQPIERPFLCLLRIHSFTQSLNLSFFTGSRCDVQTQTIDLSYTQNGSIYSPGYPKNYSNYESCRWQIEATYGERVLIYFTAFDLEDDAQCSKDSVQMFDGENSHASLLTKSCGSSLPPPVYSSGKYIYMQFTSDGSVSGEGFVAHYKALNRSSGSFFLKLCKI